MSENSAQNVPALATLFAGRAAAAGASSSTQTGPAENETSTAFSDTLNHQLRTLPGEATAGGGALVAPTDPQQPVLSTPFWPGPSSGHAMEPPSVTGHAERIAVDNRLINGLANGTLASAGESGPRINALAANLQGLPSEAGTAIQGPGTGQAPIAGLSPAGVSGETDSTTLLTTTLNADVDASKPLGEEALLPLPRSVEQGLKPAATASATSIGTQSLTGSGKPTQTVFLNDAPIGKGPVVSLTGTTTAQAAAKVPEGQALAGYQPNTTASLFAANTLGAAAAAGDNLFTLRRGTVELTGSVPSAPASTVNVTATPALTPTNPELSTALPTDRSPVQTPPALQVADQVKMMVQGDQREAQLQLHPRELGAVNIRIALNADQASVSIEASNPDLYRELASALPRLRQLFMEEGMGMAQLALDMGQSQEQERQSLEQETRLAGELQREPGAEPGEAIEPSAARGKPAVDRSLDLYA